MRPTVGKVYLTGAGPGDPRLITLRGIQTIMEADVVLYDRLVHPDLLQYAKSTAERVYVGKACGLHAMNQDAIHDCLLEYARKGAVVTRLKGGDPYVFGRGAEEALALRQAGIPFEVVSGVTSAISVPASAGIPVTCRGLAANFVVVTGHSPDLVPWESWMSVDTLVILMGLRQAQDIQQHLLHAGKAPDTPVAIISDGTTEEQYSLVGVLSELGALAGRMDERMPATIVVGDVVTLSAQLGPTILASSRRQRHGVQTANRRFERSRAVGATPSPSWLVVVDDEDEVMCSIVANLTLCARQGEPVRLDAFAQCPTRHLMGREGVIVLGGSDCAQTWLDVMQHHSETPVMWVYRDDALAHPLLWSTTWDAVCSAHIDGWGMAAMVNASHGQWQSRRALEEQIANLRQDLQGRTDIEQAKRMLMQQLSMTEEEAYHQLRRQSMNLRISVRSLAKSMLLAEQTRSAIAADCPHDSS